MFVLLCGYISVGRQGILEIGTIILDTGSKIDMTRNLKVAGWLIFGAMAISIGFEPRATFAYTIAVSESQATVQIESVAATRQYQEGLTAIAAGDLTQAIANFDRAIVLDPQYFQAYIERGNVKDGIGDLPGAIADYTTAISLNPQSAAAFYNRGTVLSKSGSHQAAVNDYTIAIGVDPQYAQAYMNRGNELDDLGNSAGALADYSRALQLRPNYALAYLNRGITYGRVGNRDRAIADFKFAAKLFKAEGNLDRYYRALKLIKDLQPEV
jgi:tetratricopeptide (TPR) repeat protein